MLAGKMSAPAFPLKIGALAAIERPAVLLLFSYDWDAEGFARFSDRHTFLHDGFDLFSFPSNARLLVFDIEHWVDRLAHRFRNAGLRAVISNNEQFGALAAALLAERLGLPGTPPAAILASQHKLVCRQVLEQVAPEANVPYFLYPCDYGESPPEDLTYPLFIKPIKAAYSVLASTMRSREQLIAHTSFGFFEQWIIKRLVKPFDDIALKRLHLPGIPAPVSANRMICEAPIQADQFNLDGWVFRGETSMLGVVDEVMYPGTQAFARFRYPSKLSAAVQARALDVAARFLRAVGFTHGMFNMEFFYDPATDRLTVIEFNPRLGSQLADLYHRVDGRDVFAMNLALAHGEDPAHVPRSTPRGGAAASFVFRSFDARVIAPVSATQRAVLAREFPDAILLWFPKSRTGIRRELKWLGSRRYAVLHLNGENEADLHRRYVRACQLLGWPAQS